jgi:hypothetical protein
MDRGNTGCGICNAAALATGFGMGGKPFVFATGMPDVATTRCGSRGRAALALATVSATAGAGCFGFELKSAEKMPTLV